jgi:indole-3-glycerol phosphate synthase/phosphoribosylanthranilate isomerase
MILDRIIEAKREAVALRKSETPLESFRDMLEPSCRNIGNALSDGACRFILECKHASPSAGVLHTGYNPSATALSYEGVADAVSVVTDKPFFDGSLEHLYSVRTISDAPLLCKDFVIDPYQVCEARRYGADSILLMASVLESRALSECLGTARALGMEPLVEVQDEGELGTALGAGARLIGINNRDLKTLKVDLSVTERLAPLVPRDATLVCESGISGRRDVLRLRPLVDAFLVGSALMQSADSGAAARELVFGRVKVCGLTSSADAAAAWKAGAVWGGLIFAEKSPRRVSVRQAKGIMSGAPLKYAGVFTDQDCSTVIETAAGLGLDAVQLHGKEDSAYIGRLKENLGARCMTWKTLHVGDSIPDTRIPGADRVLLDTLDDKKAGGTGRRFDWDLFKKHPQADRMIVGGGLGPSNAGEAGSLGAWMLDVNSGVESSPGRKSQDLLRAFFRGLRGFGRRGTGG